MKWLLTGIALLGVVAFSQRAQMTLEGHYTGQNLYLQNPESPQARNVFCIEKITVNGLPLAFENTPAFELRLDSVGLEIGDSMIITIYHFEGCKPKIIFAPPVTRHLLFEIVKLEIKDSVLCWTTKNESGVRTFIIEQYRWNKWMAVGEVDGRGLPTETAYEFKPAFHSGHNLFRLKQVDGNLKPHLSETVRFLNMNKPLKISEVDQRKRIICISGETHYELYDAGGNIVKKGFGSTIDCSNLDKGRYYLNYDNTTEPVNFGKTKAPKSKEEPLYR
jgi:hypothetical protein